jgi:hypothetical protein
MLHAHITYILPKMTVQWRISLVCWIACQVAASCTCTSSFTRPPSTPTSTGWFVPRGGGFFAASPLQAHEQAQEASNAPSSVQRIQITGIFTRRPLYECQWLQRLAAGLVLLTCWYSYQSRGDPWAKAVWELLHPHSDTDPMPAGYFPFPQDIRIAQAMSLNLNLIGPLPSPQLPALFPTTLALIALVLYGMLAFSRPHWFAYKPLLSSPPTSTTNHNNALFSTTLQAATVSGTRLTVRVRVQQCPVAGKGTSSHPNPKTTTVFCPLVQVPVPLPSSNDKKQKTLTLPIYQFNLDKRKFHWNPTTDKLIPVVEMKMKMKMK